MTETSRPSDLGTGLSLLLGVVVLAAAIATATTALLAESQGSETMQLFSGVGLAVAFVAGGLAIAVIHVFE